MNYINIIYLKNEIIRIVFGVLKSLAELFWEFRIFVINFISEKVANTIKLFIMNYIDIILLKNQITRIVFKELKSLAELFGNLGFSW